MGMLQLHFHQAQRSRGHLDPMLVCRRSELILVCRVEKRERVIALWNEPQRGTHFAPPNAVGVLDDECSSSHPMNPVARKRIAYCVLHWVVVDGYIGPVPEPGHNGVFDEHLFNVQGVELTASLPWTTEIWCRSQPNLPQGNRQSLGVSCSVKCVPPLSHAVREKRIRSLQAFPRIRIIPALQDNSYVDVRPTNTAAALDF